MACFAARAARAENWRDFIVTGDDNKDTVKGQLVIDCEYVNEASTMGEGPLIQLGAQTSGPASERDSNGSWIAALYTNES